MREKALFDRRIGDDRPMALPHPWDQVPLDAAALEVVEDFVRNDALQALLEPRELREVFDVEVADAGVADLLRAEQRVETRERLLERNVAAPVQEIQVDAIGSEPRETPLARRGHAPSCRVLRIELGHDKDVVTPAGDRFADDPLRAAIGVHLGRVDQRHAEIDAEPERGNFGLPRASVLAHAPRALTEHR